VLHPFAAISTSQPVLSRQWSHDGGQRRRPRRAAGWTFARPHGTETSRSSVIDIANCVRPRDSRRRGLCASHDRRPSRRLPPTVAVRPRRRPSRRRRKTAAEAAAVRRDWTSSLRQSAERLRELYTPAHTHTSRPYVTKALYLTKRASDSCLRLDYMCAL